MTAVTEEPVSRIMTVSRLRQFLEKYPSDMLVFIRNQAGDYYTATFEVSEEGDLELGAQ